MIIAIISDVHGNKNAFISVLSGVAFREMIEGFVFLGDFIDYGPHSNEVIEILKENNIPILCNIWGNHEEAIINEHYERFSSDRGRNSARYTLRTLTKSSMIYIKEHMVKDGSLSFDIGDKKCLAVHGSLEDPYWGSIHPGDKLDAYQEYDVVFSGHSHEPHYFEKFFKAESVLTRNRKKTIFINPGSVGQPRNINNCAQYAIFDTKTEETRLMKVSYDIESEMKSFSNEVDVFYKERLMTGV